uniref:Putative WRKY transcription factor 45 n=1 Tax=Davidia involucrata TaxID=16924 RepID=A0A5B7BZ47_DAVIN
MDRGVNNKLDLPEDGYQWRKYGQKFIKHVRKYRSYFKCHKSNCRAKKRADWSNSQPGDLRVVYDGVHTHAPLTLESSHSPQAGTNTNSTSGPNPYDLLTQVLGDQSTTSFRHDN